MFHVINLFCSCRSTLRPLRTLVSSSSADLKYNYFDIVVISTTTNLTSFYFRNKKIYTTEIVFILPDTEKYIILEMIQVGLDMSPAKLSPLFCRARKYIIKPSSSKIWKPTTNRALEKLCTWNVPWKRITWLHADKFFHLDSRNPCKYPIPVINTSWQGQLFWYQRSAANAGPL